MLTEEIWKVCNRCYVFNRSIQNKCIDMGNVHDVVDENRHLGSDFPMNSEIYKNTRFENIEKMFNITQINYKRTFRRNSECERPGISITITNDIDIDQQSSDQMGDAKKLCPR